MQTITRKRKLRSFQPLWTTTRKVQIAAQQRIPANIVDVLIVGAGIGGALMALSLAKQNLTILVVDRRQPVQGSTLASTAMIQHEIDVPLHRLTAMVGQAKARRAWQRSARAVETLTSLVDNLGICCHLERKKSLYLAGNTYGARALKAEAAARDKAGISAVFLNATQLRENFGLERTAAIEAAISASANPAQLTAGLWRKAQAEGVAIVEDTEITDIRSLHDWNAAATSKGEIIQARHVVFCTGYEFLDAVANQEHRIVSTWALATKPHHPRPNWLKDYVVWEGSDPYLYIRSTADGRIIVGGEDEEDPTAHQDSVKLSSKSRTLRAKLSALLKIPIAEPAYQWAAAFGVAADGLPIIGPVPALKNVYAVMGYGGNGITYSQIAAEIVSSAILGHQDPDSELFAFR
ncbi:FAD-binding oxidoreductase (plasmid) [Ensifer adhaerens]|uniref:NAD(P)/FAD-dependent oxidoreductase n=1 Tax=Ensifer adhaerens TaxID=106592 RepID=UPI0023A91C12|nr:FAD-binding oxidoreductase [Ensifer adhaerens]WDZ81916.1 FAD-binding oxidoreductase [Ensifer adhaerens]